MITYFIDAVDYIATDESVPYYLGSKIYDQTVFLDYDQASQVLHKIIESERSVHILRYFEKYKILSPNFNFLYELKGIGQKKHKSKNVFDHIMRVLGEVSHPQPLMKWAAIFHDVGKGISAHQDVNFHKHAEYSLKITKIMTKLYNIDCADALCTVVKYHMLPLEYQRNPIWSETAIRNFIDKCTPRYVLSVVDFSYYDKKAETDKMEFLEPLVELRRKIKKLI